MFNHDYVATVSRAPQAKTRRLLALAIVACVAAWGAAAWAAFAQQTTVGPAITAQGQAKAGPAPAAQPARPLIGVLNRQRLGLTVRNVVRTLEAMKADGSLAGYVRQTERGDRVLDTSALAVAVADRIAGENPKAWADVDWEAVLAFLERLLELLAKWLPIILELLAKTSAMTLYVAA